MDLIEAAKRLEQFTANDLTHTLAKIESRLPGLSANQCAAFLTESGVDNELLSSAQVMKRAAAQIHVIIHALGILNCLPCLLEEGEKVESLSLGAGNTGRKFDLETNFRVAEFKFIAWQGGPEAIRQNSIFKDFFELAEHSTPKRKYLYVLDAKHPDKFFNGRRALSSVLSRNTKLSKEFFEKYGDRYATVSDYYREHKHKVILESISRFMAGTGQLAEAISEAVIE